MLRKKSHHHQSNQPPLMLETVGTPITVPEEIRETLIQMTAELIAVYWQEGENRRQLLLEESPNAR